MDQDKLKQHLENLAENFDEILTSTAAVKGDAFAQAASVGFEGAQLMELIGRLASLSDERHAEYAKSLMDSGMEILSNIVAKACGDLDEEQFNEAMAMGHSMYKRRNQTMDAIRKELKESE